MPEGRTTTLARAVRKMTASVQNRITGVGHRIAEQLQWKVRTELSHRPRDVGEIVHPHRQLVGGKQSVGPGQLVEPIGQSRALGGERRGEISHGQRREIPSLSLTTSGSTANPSASS